MSHPLFRDQYIAHIVLNKRKKKMDGIYKKKKDGTWLGIKLS